MARIPRSGPFFSVVLCGMLGARLLPACAEDKQPDRYPLSGKVLAIASKSAHFYQVATDNRIYLLMCEKGDSFHPVLPECKVDNRPIAAGDTVKFRIDGDWAYLQEAKDAEEGLRILNTELRVIPRLPTTSTASDSAKTASSSPTLGREPALVIGTGVHIRGQKAMGWSTSPQSVGTPGSNSHIHFSSIAMASPSAPDVTPGPVMAVPATGGAPFLVIPTGPASGGVVTGVPVTGGAPIVGIATGPPAGVPAGGAPISAGRSMIRIGGGGGGVGEPEPWVHILRLQSDKSVYMLECSLEPCEIDAIQIDLGDSFMIRVDNN